MIKKSLHPEIRIQVGWHIISNASVHINELRGNGAAMVSDQQMEDIVKAYNEEWDRHEDKILKSMHKVTDLSFYQNVIDVFIAPWFAGFSSPMIMGIQNSPDEFVDSLTHELLHRLFTDNTSLPHSSDYISKWGAMFGEEHSFEALVHIPVHAAHKAIILDVMDDPERIQREKDMCIKHGLSEYIKAWDYVEKRGHEAIINDLRTSYSV